MPIVVPKDARPDPTLTALAVELGTGTKDTVDRIAPVAMVDNLDFKYATYGREDIKNDASPKRAPGTTANEVSLSQTFATASVELRSLKNRIPLETLNNAPNPQAIRARRTRVVVNKHILNNTVNIATAMKNCSNTQTAPSIKWDAANAKIRADILAAKDAFRRLSGYSPNVMVVSPAVASAMFNDSGILDLLKYTHDELLAKGYKTPVEMMDVWVPGAIIDSANPGAAASIGDVFNTDEAWYMYVEPMAGDDLEAPTALRQVRSKASVGTAFAAYNYLDPDPTAKCEWVAVDCDQTELVISQNLILRHLDLLT